MLKQRQVRGTIDSDIPPETLSRHLRPYELEQQESLDQNEQDASKRDASTRIELRTPEVGAQEAANNDLEDGIFEAAASESTATKVHWEAESDHAPATEASVQGADEPVDIFAIMDDLEHSIIRQPPTPRGPPPSTPQPAPPVVLAKGLGTGRDLTV